MYVFKVCVFHSNRLQATSARDESMSDGQRRLSGKKLLPLPWEAAFFSFRVFAILTLIQAVERQRNSPSLKCPPQYKDIEYYDVGVADFYALYV